MQEQPKAAAMFKAGTDLLHRPNYAQFVWIDEWIATGVLATWADQYKSNVDRIAPLRTCLRHNVDVELYLGACCDAPQLTFGLPGFTYPEEEARDTRGTLIWSGRTEDLPDTLLTYMNMLREVNPESANAV